MVYTMYMHSICNVVYTMYIPEIHMVYHNTRGISMELTWYIHGKFQPYLELIHMDGIYVFVGYVVTDEWVCLVLVTYLFKGWINL